MSASEIFTLLHREPLGLAAGAVLGALLGSFINVVIYRLPRDLSLVRPRSKCPHCGAGIAFYDNIPLVSYFVLGGRCRRCRGPISARYPLVEALGAALTAVIVGLAPTPLMAVVWIAFALSLLAVLFIDFDYQIIPDAITLPGIVVGLVAAAFGPLPFRDSVIGVAVGGGGLLLVAEAYRRIARREGLGLGDVKLMAMVGAFLGWRGALATLILGSLAGSLVGGALIASRRGTRLTALPFGSFLAPAAWAALFFGPWLWRAYLRLLGG
jgi:leader peptidase (prepilin peptidase) / N-methyltransferase